jgi:predicted SAM-dependent methyltransferase
MNLDVGGQLNRNDQSGTWKIVDLHEGADFRINLECDVIPVESGEVSNIYTSHCLEHLEPGRLRAVFADMYRVLREGGRLRMVVPSFLKGVGLYFTDPGKLRGPVMPRLNTNTPDTKMSRLSSWFYTEVNPINGTPGHKTAWDFELASAYLTEAGFVEIRECSLELCSAAFVGKDNPLYEPFSLYVECRK